MEELTVAVTDSGLGGLSVAADLAARLTTSGISRRARVAFVNALFDDALWYNDLPDDATRARVFDAALEAIERRYRPDAILIACNTLSVFYPLTTHAREASRPADSIVPAGVEFLAHALTEHAQATAILFATPGTIAAGAHRRALVARGIAEDRIVGQACPRLSTVIEHDPRGPHARERIGAFVAAALAQRPGQRGPLVASLNCTHYGYAGPLWAEAFGAAGFPGTPVLDPNPRLADVVLERFGPRRFAATEVAVEVVSKTPLPDDVRASLGGLLNAASPPTATALHTYTLDRDLFHVEV
ncbi:MAG: aspartate/glutamate racemase family protein [Vicinamibacteria bacterium]|nr:aspartate/glutamate racemase family protein [Vicinamibacteria bacterium]